MASIAGIELTGKIVLVRKSWFKPEFAEGDRRFVCESGFGCSPDCCGTRIYGKFVSDGEQTSIRRGDVEQVVES